MQPPQTTVSVLTVRGMAAISSIALTGEGARDILEKVFRAANTTAKQSLTVPPTERILHGSIVEGDRVIDEVVVGCEGHDCFAIHCHGNPLLVEQIVKLLQMHGAVLTDADSAALTRFQADSKTMIEAEVKLAMQKSATVWGAKLLRAQIDGGLSKWTKETLEAVDSLDENELKRQCVRILDHSRIGRSIIEGVRIVIAGPPNSGKSTLLNRLAGQPQAVVSDTAGTTRDWVSITCLLGEGDSKIRAEIFDTAGLDAALAGQDTVERTAQTITRQLLDTCDLILYVQDAAAPGTQNQEQIFDADKPVIYVNNKCDLLQEPRNPGTQELKPVFISAKENTGIGRLVREIIRILELTEINVCLPIVFTCRQHDLIGELLKPHRLPGSILRNLLHGKNAATQ